MERLQEGYSGIVSALRRQQMEALNANLRAQANLEREKEANQHEELYWVKFNDIAIDDINELIKIYARITGFSPSPLEDQDYRILTEEFTGHQGFCEYQIHKSAKLEARRRISSSGELFVRFKISGKQIFATGENGKDKIEMQDEIDAYFLSKNMAVALRQTY